MSLTYRGAVEFDLETIELQIPLERLETRYKYIVIWLLIDSDGILITFRKHVVFIYITFSNLKVLY